MKSQWIIVCGLGLALLTAIVAVFNTDVVPLNYIVGEVEVSLIVVISSAILVGGLIVTVFGMVRPYQLNKENERLESLTTELHTENEDLKLRLSEAQAAYSMSKKEQEEVNVMINNNERHPLNGFTEVEKSRIL
jgi:putative membrane protein